MDGGAFLSVFFQSLLPFPFHSLSTFLFFLPLSLTYLFPLKPLRLTVTLVQIAKVSSFSRFLFPLSLFSLFSLFHATICAYTHSTQTTENR
jgi:hypothetical protein